MTARWSVLALAGGLIVGATVYLHGVRPYQDTLGSYSTDLEPRTAAQRRNIAAGARRIDGVEIEPGAVFSFNRTVGPRTATRGFVPAASFLEGARLESVGGGICQVSSTLYGAALAANLRISERVAHDRTVSSVPPGGDATVWYGKADLAIANSASQPVRISAGIAGDRLRVAIMGTDAGGAVVSREVLAPPASGTVRVRTWRTAAGERELVSDDVYRR